MGITNTIGGAELAAITAAVLHAHSHTMAIELLLAASRLSTKSGSTCFTLSITATTHKGIFWRCSYKLTVRNSPTPMLVFVRSHAGIAGDECTDAVARYQAKQS